MPIENQIQRYFQKNNLLIDTINHVHELENRPNSVIQNIVHSSLWKRKKELYPGKTLLPFYLFHDGFETGNALNSTAGKQSLAAFYYSFPYLPGNRK